MYGRNAKKRTMTFDEENQHGVKVPKTVRFVKTEKLGISSYPSVSTIPACSDEEGIKT
jgi:hypothetical protein